MNRLLSYNGKWKSVVATLGGIAITLFLLGSLVVYMNFIFRNAWVTLLLIICCPIVALSFVFENRVSRKNLEFLLFAVGVMSACCSFAILNGHGKHKVLLESIFLKGQKKYSKELAQQYTGDDDEDSGTENQHYETYYSYLLEDGESQMAVSVIEVSLTVLSVSVPIFVFYLWSLVSQSPFYKDE